MSNEPSEDRTDNAPLTDDYLFQRLRETPQRLRNFDARDAKLSVLMTVLFIVLSLSCTLCGALLCRGFAAFVDWAGY